MSILKHILEQRELTSLQDELNYIEEYLENTRNQLNVLQEEQDAMQFADRYDNEWELFDEASRRLEVAKKALALANRLSKPEDRAKHRKIVFKLLNQLRGLLRKLITKLTKEERSA